MQVNQTFYDLMADKFLNQYQRSPHRYHHMQKERDRFLELLPYGLILDAGCGSGVQSKELSEMGYKLAGIDIAHNQLKNASILNPNLVFAEMNLLSLGFKNEVFDGVWANALLIHVNHADIKQAVRELYRVLKPKGIGYISFKIAEVKPKQDLRSATFYYSLEEMLEVSYEVGFEVVDSYEYNENERVKRDRQVRWGVLFLRK